MFTRATGFVIIPVWLFAMSWLVIHDIVPAWTAMDAPALHVTDALRGAAGNSQHVITDASGEIGRIWTTYLIDESSIRRDDCVWIERLPVDVTPLRITAASTFTPQGTLDELTVMMENEDHLLRLHGERFDADFSFTLETGLRDVTAFKVPLSDGAMISAAFNPFSNLDDLKVGQRWRIQVFNPIATLMPLGDRFVRMLVEVTGEERISTPLGERNCLVVESPNSKAWVDATGSVVRQDMTMPFIGAITIMREPKFDRETMNAIQHMSIGRTKKHLPR